MKNKSLFSVMTAALISFALAIAAAAAYIFAYTNTYDTEIRHFAADSVSAVVFTVLFVLSAAAALGIPFILRRRGSLNECAPNQIESFVLWFMSFLFIALALINFTSLQPGTVENEATGGGFLSGFRALYNEAFHPAPGTPMNFGTVCSFLAVPLSLLSAIPFALAVSDRLRGGAVHGLTSFCPILWSACLLFKYYFDLTEMPLNDPELALTLTSVSAIMIFFVSESRSAVGLNTPAISAFASVISASLGGTVAVARIILNLTAGHSIPSLMENIIFFAAGVLALVRLLSLGDKLPVQSDTETDALFESDDGEEAECTDTEDADN